MKAEFLKTKLDSRNVHQLTGQDVLIIANQEAGRKLINKLPYGNYIELEYQEARYYPRLQAYWATLRDIVDNYKQPEYESLDSVSKLDFYLRVKAGFVEFRIGNVIKPRSIAYENCSEEDFINYLKSIEPIIEEITGIDYQSFRNRKNEN